MLLEAFPELCDGSVLYAAVPRVLRAPQDDRWRQRLLLAVGRIAELCWDLVMCLLG
jgi:hypothetical protein